MLLLRSWICNTWHQFGYGNNLTRIILCSLLIKFYHHHNLWLVWIIGLFSKLYLEFLFVTFFSLQVPQFSLSFFFFFFSLLRMFLCLLCKLMLQIYKKQQILYKFSKCVQNLLILCVYNINLHYKYNEYTEIL